MYITCFAIYASRARRGLRAYASGRVITSAAALEPPSSLQGEPLV